MRNNWHSIKRQPCVYCGELSVISLNSALSPLHRNLGSETSSPAAAIRSFLIIIWPMPGLLSAALNTLGTKQDALFHCKNNELHWDDTGPDVTKSWFPTITFPSDNEAFLATAEPTRHSLMTWKSSFYKSLSIRLWNNVRLLEFSRVTVWERLRRWPLNLNL